ncbi:branched-chain amino acid transport system II carrier protein [[Bacillus thuringiensis] serovar konkukian]|nr:branched-chain amino acid transport system II carrier protein [Bacillus thuringiensis]ANN35526.1 branched-chain amino acid transport system II carrier protein [Bacillus thuringiensis serovar coreanensis]MED1305645.1 branched-chain amino acid transport system II carrier protein [Bacillus pacificus]OUA92177.1 branched-chain amino acid transport system II carrier protein [[Bacillus thuringiensis] serovar konkukian]
MKKSLSVMETIPIGLMLFAIFFGAGNMIFPPALGQMAGMNVWTASLGFIVSGVGLPLLAIAAISLFDGDISKLASRVHPACAVIIPLIIYLAIGPFFAVPRTGTVSYEIAIAPFLSNDMQGEWYILFLFTLIYFSITFYLSLNPSKLVDRIGKYMTPALLVIIGIIIVKAIVAPVGAILTPIEEYKEAAFFKGFTEGFLTMDALGALVLGIIVINAIKEKGITDQKAIAKSTMIAGFIAAIGLTGIYLSLAYIGATTMELGMFDNGGILLTTVVQKLFGQNGLLLLGFAILCACLTTSIGLVSACGKFLKTLLPNVSYKKIIFIICLFSFVISNLGLSMLIKVSLPVLIIMYPVAIVLIILAFLDHLIGGRQSVYIGAVVGALLVSSVQGLETAGLVNHSLLQFMQKVPLYTEGMGWLLLALLGGIIGFIVPQKTKNSSEQFNNVN